MDSSYTYEIYGLKVRSFAPLDRYRTRNWDGEADLTIARGDIQPPEEDLPDTVYKPYTVFNKDFFYLHIPQICTYLVPSTTEVILSPDPEATLEECLLFLYDTVLPVALIRNNVFLFQASAIKANDGVWLFCGDSGVGKSTLVSALVLQKRRLFVEDDRVYLWKHPKTGKFVTSNQSPITELWGPSAATLKIDKREKFVGWVRNGIRKRLYDLSPRMAKRPHPVTRMYLLTSHNADPSIDLQDIRGIQKLQVLAKHNVMDHVVAPMGKHREHFQFLAELLQQVNLHNIKRSQLTSIKDLTNYVYAAIKE